MTPYPPNMLLSPIEKALLNQLAGWLTITELHDQLHGNYGEYEIRNSLTFLTRRLLVEPISDRPANPSFKRTELGQRVLDHQAGRERRAVLVGRLHRGPRKFHAV